MDVLTLNRFLVILNRRTEISDLPPEKKERVVSRIIKDVATTGIFELIHVEEPEEEKWEQIDAYVYQAFYGHKEKKIAVKNNHEAVKEKIIEIEKINDEFSMYQYGRTPLHEAVDSKDEDNIKKYAETQEYVDDMDHNGNTPYEMAVLQGYNRAVEILSNCMK